MGNILLLIIICIIAPPVGFAIIGGYLLYLAGCYSICWVVDTWREWHP